MDWKMGYWVMLDYHKLFENYGHRRRFIELMDCFGDQPFFTKGLCKCMYLSAWDEEHFAIMLETLTAMSLGQEEDTSDMRRQGDILAEQITGPEYYVFQLSNAFLDNKPFALSPKSVLDDGTRHIIEQALKAAEVIDGI